MTELIRLEMPADRDAIQGVNLAAFAPRTEEAALVDRLRENGGFLLSLVWVDGEAIVGHALFTPVVIRSEKGEETPGVGLGPIAILPRRQNEGIGGRLIREGLAQLREMGQRYCVVLGHSEYYPRFGFRRSDEFGIRCKWEVPPEVFMIQELAAGALDGVAGVVHYRPEFDAV